MSTPDPHKGAQILLDAEKVPFEDDELENVKAEIVDPEIIIPCEHKSDSRDCEHCYDPELTVTIKLTFEYQKTASKRFSCEFIYETTPQAMIDTIIMKDKCGAEEAYLCDGNSFHTGQDYFWCREHQGEYSELKLGDILINSDFDTATKPITMMKTGAKSLTLKEATFTEL